MEYVLVSLRLSLVRYGFVEVWGVLPWTLLYCTENVQVFMRVSGGGGRGLWIPPKIVVFPCYAGPVKNQKVANLAFNVGPSSVCQQIQWRFAGGPLSQTASTLALDEVSSGLARMLVARCRHANSAPYQKK